MDAADSDAKEREWSQFLRNAYLRNIISNITNTNISMIKHNFDPMHWHLVREFSRQRWALGHYSFPYHALSQLKLIAL